MSLTLQPIPGIPMIKPGDDLAKIILQSTRDAGVTFENEDILVVAQKIVSKAEGRLVNLTEVTPSQKALKYAA